MAGKTRRLTRRQHRAVVRVVEHAERTTGAQFCVYLGPTGEDPRAHAEAVFHEAGLHARPAVLLLISPEDRRVEVVTSAEIPDRVSDRTCSAAVDAMTALFERSDIVGGIVEGVEQLEVAAGPGARGVDAFPDVIED